MIVRQLSYVVIRDAHRFAESMGAYKQQFSPHWPTIDAALLAKTEYYLMQDLVRLWRLMYIK
jgi:hypothetical protein